MQNKNLESRIQNVECKIKPKDKILKSLNPKFYQLNSTKKAFTLVELIVTIVLLAILTTISFLSFQGFSKSSRDSVRISDIDNIEKNLGLFIVNTGYYPTPDNPTSITYKGGLAWVQGTIGDNVTKNIENINKKPIDPLTNSEYAYSITNNKREYQIGTIIEEASTAYIKENLFTQKTYALGTKKVIAKIKGTYNEKIIKVSTGGVSYVLAIPSIITSNLNNTDIESIISNKELVYNDYSNVPDSYKTSGYTMTGGFEFSPQEIVAYSGSSIDFTNNENKIEFVTNLQKIYSGTVVEGTNTYDEIMKIDTIGEPDKAVNLINNYIVNNVGGISGKITTVFFNSCTLDGQTINHNQQVTAYSENNISYGSSYSCIDRAQTRTCVDGVLSGSEDYKYSNCIKGEPTNCEASGSYLYYSHTYSIPLINHAEILTGVLSTGVSENNGIYSYILSSIECNDGNLINPIEEENPTVISCNTGYTISGNSCVTATYTISGDFGTNASGATVDVCGSDVIADENGIFSTIRNYGSTCDTISALRTGYTCSTTTQGPTILTENISNILGLCSINSYTVSFDGNGGTGHTPTSKSVTYNSSIGTLPTNPTKDGYTFNGWYTQSTGGSQITESTTVLGDATVYAQWSINNYTITFDGNGGTGHTPTSKSVTYNSSIGTLPTNPTKDGYTFNGWYTQSTGGSQITESTTVLGDATVYAQWNVNNYTITFDGNGGTGHTPTNKSVIYNTAIGTLPSTPTMTGYTFNGWYTSASGGTQINTGTIVTGDATVYAQWNINNYTVTFDGNGGTGHTPTSKLVTYNTAIGTLPSNPTRTGYTFNGWYTAISGGTQVTINTVVLGDATLYAQWTINDYIVTFDGNGGTGHTPTSKSVTYNTAIGTLPSNPTRTGYTFAGWYTASSGGTQVTINTVVLGDATLYAQWIQDGVCGTANGTATTTAPSANLCSVGTASLVTTNTGNFTWTCSVAGANTGSCSATRQYTITFNSNSGSTASPTSKVVNYNTAIGTLATTTRTGYTFNGWYTASTGGSQVITSTIVLGDATVYAQWSLNTYTVSGDFGTNASGATINVCGTNVTATSTGTFSTARNYGSTCNTIAATRTGYTCSTTTQGPASLTTSVSNIAGSCSLNTYTVSGNFGTNASGATINVCGTNQSATSTGIFSTTRNYGSVCNTIAATRTNYTCSTTTQGPASLTANVTNVAGSCSANTQVASCTGKIANSSYNTATSITQTWNGTSWLPTNVAVYNTTASTTACRYACSTGYHTEDSGTSCISDTKSCTITNGTGIQTWSGGTRGSCVLSSCNSGYTATVDSCEKSSLMTNIIGYWDFDDGSGQITKDKLGNGNDLNVYNDSTDIGSWVSGKTDGAYQVHGSGWITTTGLNFSAPVKTVSFWFKIPDISDNEGTFLCYENSAGTNLEDNLGQNVSIYGNSMDTSVYQRQVLSNKTISDTSWHFFSFSKGTDTMVCLDGICENTGINSSTWSITPDVFNFNGGCGYGFSEFSKGIVLDELRMFSTSYTKTQLEQIYTDSSGSPISIVDYNGAKRYSNGTYAANCEGYLNSTAYNNNGNGLYWIKYSTSAAIQVECDMVNGGYMKAFDWNRINSGATLADFQSKMTLVYNTMTDFIESDTGAIRWSDYNASGDVLDYYANVALPNSGSLRLDLNYLGYSMDTSGTWFYVTDASGNEVNVVCGAENVTHATYYDLTTEQIYIPAYTCTNTTAGSWTWNQVYTGSAGSEIKKLNLTSMHADSGLGDYSKLYKMVLWVK